MNKKLIDEEPLKHKKGISLYIICKIFGSIE